MAKLNEEAINEVMTILNEVKDVVRLLWEFGININSDCWSASTMGGEDILHWERKDFEEFDEISKGDEFYIGGNIVTGNQHKYKGESIIAPKELAETEGEIFKKYLTSVINSVSIKHFDLEIEDEYGLINNCGWEHWIIIKTTVRESALEKDNIVKEYLEEIDEQWDDCECIYKALTLVLCTDCQVEWERIYRYIKDIIKEIDKKDGYGASCMRNEIFYRKERAKRNKEQ